MKFNVEVEIDWLGEDGDLDEAVRKQVIDGVVARLSEGFVKGIVKDASQQVNDRIDQLVTNLFEGFMSKGVTVTNRWGEVEKEGVSIVSLIKERLDGALVEKVDSQGRPSHYGDKTRLQYMIDERVQKAVDKVTKNVVEQVDAKIAATLNDAIKSKLSASLLAKIDVDGILKKVMSELK